MNLPDNSKNPSAIPVGANGETLVSNSPGAHPTCAPGALLLPTCAELNAFWPEGIRGFAPRKAWQALCKQLGLTQPQPARN